ncbi:MAG: IS200/IS605 family transposase [Ignavibacteriae bacterium]|nr:IS200/IS605 family transposase [Ignavibacteriota bacterium]
MGKVYHKLFYHAIWTTYLRQPIITEEIENVLYPYIELKASKYNCQLLGIGGIEDHIHIAIRIPPAESVSDIIGKIKGSSSHHLNKDLAITEDFAWQDGFGVLSFTEKDLSGVLRYIQNQKVHHKENKLNSVMERTDEEKK